MSTGEQKKRLDLLLAEQRPDLSRSRIQAEIMAGNVLVNGRVSDKPGTIYAGNVKIELLEPKNPYVSRGGLKLEGALQELQIDVKGLVVLDVGSSTGGFTDCLLKKGAERVYALDVGYGQLDQRLRSDSRVIVMERFNIRHLRPGDLEKRPDLAVIDVSFISLSKVMPVLSEIEIPAVLALVKPQFEAGRVEAGRGKGVIRDPALHRSILNNTVDMAFKNDYCFFGITFSRWPGPRGNIEYFIYTGLEREKEYRCLEDYAGNVDQAVERAHDQLRGKKN